MVPAGLGFRGLGVQGSRRSSPLQDTDIADVYQSDKMRKRQKKTSDFRFRVSLNPKP